MTVDFVSLFSGAGGLDLGFARAGARPIWANDLSADAVNTYNALASGPGWIGSAFAESHAVAGPMSVALSAARASLKRESPALLVGGPPCQGFSIAGHMDPTDPRSELVFDFLEAVATLRPKAFVMENVPALAEHPAWSNVRRAIERECRDGNLGRNYKLHMVVLNAVDCGVPQYRRRVFFIGLPPSASLAFSTVGTSVGSVRSALVRLPAYGSPGNDTALNASVVLAKNPVVRRSPHAGMLFNGQGRPLDVDEPAPTLHASMGGNRTPIVEQAMLDDANAESWVAGYHHRLYVDKKPPLARLPKEATLRRITVEEAAALQAFPAEVKWSGSTSSRYRQIGNAVPPPLAFRVAQAVLLAIGESAIDREAMGTQPTQPVAVAS